jgi:hypothetical protein
MEIVDVNVLAFVAAAAFVLAKLWSMLTDRLPFWARMTPLGREIGGYVIIAASGVLMWLTTLNALPGFHEAGRVLTCVVGALGPSAVFDVLYDKPQPPIVDPDEVPEM